MIPLPACIALSSPTAQQSVGHEFWGHAPAWAKLGRDAHGRMVWLRLQRNGFNDETDSALYSDGRMVQRNGQDFPALVFGYPITVTSMGSAWMVFVDWSYGAGSTYETAYNLIDKRSFKLLAEGSFEHGDARQFERTHQFIEYKYLKYANLHNELMPRFLYNKMIWKWDAKRRRFTYAGGCFSNRFDDVEKAEWAAATKTPSPEVEGLQRFGLPKGSTLLIDEGVDPGVKLTLRGRVLARKGLKLGELEETRPPRISKEPQGLVLTFADFEASGVMRHRVLVQRHPYRLTQLISNPEHEWAPFGELK